jgi:integrase
MGAPQPPGHAAVKLSAWPAADRAAYEAACVAGSPFDEGGAAAQWRPATHKALTGAYSRWLGYLAEQGVDLAGTAPPDRITPERMADYVRFLVGRCASVTVSSYLGQLHMFARDVWPDGDWRWLCDLQARRQRLAEPSRNKAARIVPQEDLLQLGCGLMVEAAALELDAADARRANDQAIGFRDGLMIALLAMRPLRQLNFLGLQIGRQLRQAGAGWMIMIPAAESKTHAALKMAFPEVLVPGLEAYLDLYRPRLLDMRAGHDPARPWREPGRHLWIAATGMPMTAGALQKLLRRHTEAQFGHEVNCHLFRDCLATSITDEDPELVRIAADLLGHHSLQTTRKYYVAANQLGAMRRYQAAVLRRRKQARRGEAGVSG